MTIDEFVELEKGKKHLIPGQSEIYRGQCVQLIGIYTKAVFNQDLPPHPIAKDYWTNGIPEWEKVSSPQKGDIVVYDGHTGYSDGHIAIYYDGRVFEENADPDGSAAHLAIRTNTYLLGYLRKKGNNNIMNRNQILRLYGAYQDRVPSENEITSWVGRDMNLLEDALAKDPFTTSVYGSRQAAKAYYKKYGPNPPATIVDRPAVLDYINKHLT